MIRVSKLARLLATTALAATVTLLSPAISAPALAQAAATAPAQPGPWMNTSLSSEQRTQLLLKEMTMQEKVSLLMGHFSSNGDWMNARGFIPGLNWKQPEGSPSVAAGYVPGIARLNIPAQVQTDAGVGVASQGGGVGARERTALPSGIATAATWNLQRAFEGGRMIGREAYLSGFNVQLAGGVNLLREPRNGRNFEYGGEDPLLAGTMVGMQIAGIQSNPVISTLKHFAYNDQETNRFTINVIVDDAAGRMSDLLALQFANEVGKPGSVMCSYNRVNGHYGCENPYLLNEVLKGDWGFKGYVMSDWGATHSTVPAANAGLDQQSGFPFDYSNYFGGALLEAVQNNHVPEARLNDMAGRILWAMFDKGLFDHPVSDQSASIDLAAHADVTRADAEEAIVLLKNTPGLLPLSTKVRRIAIIGGHADVGVLSGGGSSQVYPVGGMAVPDEWGKGFPGPMVYYPSSPMRELQERTSATITYNDGKDIKAAARLAAQSDVVIVFGTQWTGEAIDSPMALDGNQDALITAVAKANRKTVVVLETGGPVAMPWLKQVGAVLEAWYPGTSGGEAIARVLTGEVNPSGHLPATFPASVEQLPRPVIDGDPTKADIRPDTNYNIEGAAVGYKWFDLKGLTPLFPFGHGLSYTTFDLSRLKATVEGNTVSAQFTIHNTGKLAGQEVGQVYVARVGGGLEAPKRLGGYAKLDLKPGELKSANVTIDPRLFAMWDTASKTWKIEGGDYQIILARSAAEPVETVVVHLEPRTLDVHGR